VTSEHLTPSLTLPTVDQILEYMSVSLNINKVNLLKAKRGEYNLPRNLAIYACRLFGKVSTSEIAKIFGCNAHSNISNIVARVSTMIASDKKLESFFMKLGMDLESLNLRCDK
jgi:chromosomal replication initiation ATPase DnaA